MIEMNGYSFCSLDLERRSVLVVDESKGKNAHTHQITAMNPLETFSDHGLYS